MTWLTLAFCTGYIIIQETCYKIYLKYFSDGFEDKYVKLDKEHQNRLFSDDKEESD